jgi:hypothetical protein
MQTLHVRGEGAERLRERLVPDSHPADSMPRDPLPDPGPVLETVKDVDAHVRGEPGAVVVDFDVRDATDDEVTSVGWNFFTCLCTPVPQYRTGELIYPVEVADVAPGESHYSRSSDSGNLHTDGTFLPRPPDVAALLCLSSAQSGGETILIDGRELIAELRSRNPDAVAILSRDHPFDCLGQLPGYETRRQPIFTESGRGFVLRYLRKYIEQGYAKTGKDVPAGLTDALDQLDALASDEARQDAVRLARGQMLVFDNHRFLHGRRAFSEAKGRRRRLRRIYGAYEERRQDLAAVG